MEMNQYQKEALQFASYPKAESEKGAPMAWTYPALALAEESGEVCGKLAKALRDNWGFLDEAKKLEIKKELGDVLWELSALASELGLQLDDIAESNINKLTDRQKRGVISGSGDNR